MQRSGVNERSVRAARDVDAELSGSVQQGGDDERRLCRGVDEVPGHGLRNVPRRRPPAGRRPRSDELRTTASPLRRRH